MNLLCKSISLSAFIAGGFTLNSYAQQPNILWVMAEDMGQDLACYGMKGVKTPVLDQMAKEGILYTNACCSNPISSPSRSGMMTGVHQTEIDAHNHRSNRSKPLRAGVYPITYHLRKAGYTCILGNDTVFDRGTKIDCNFKTTALGGWNGIDKFGLFDKKGNFSAADQPFFAQIQLKITHRGDWWKSTTAQSEHPVNPDSVKLPAFMADHPKIREEWACYLDQVEYMDHEMGILLEQLKQEGLLDNTIVFFIADNGRCDIRGKGYLYEPGTKIPMIVWGKGVKPSVVNDVVSTLDISATVLDQAGVCLPDYLTGKPLLKDGKPTQGHKSFYAARDSWDEIVECMRSISTTHFTYIRNYMPEVGWDRHQHYLDFHRPAVHVMRQLYKDGKLSKGEALFFAPVKPKEELYDIVDDPEQLTNLVGNPKYTKNLAQLSSLMDKWQREHVDMGLEDRLKRRSNSSKEVDIRAWLQTNYPVEWQKILNGEIVEQYKEWSDKAGFRTTE